MRCLLGRQQCESLYITGECCSLSVHGCRVGHAAAYQGWVGLFSFRHGCAPGLLSQGTE